MGGKTLKDRLSKTLPDNLSKTLQDNLRVIASRAVEEAARNAGTRLRNGRSSEKPLSGMRGSTNPDGPLSGTRGVLVGAGAAALVPAALKARKLVKGVAANGLGDIASAPVKAVEKLGSGVGGAIGDKVSDKVEQAGGPAGILKDAAKSALPFGGGGDDKGAGKGGVAGVGKGRRMPVQQSVDIAAPIESVYNQWTQFEQWPEFMHRVTRVTQEDDCTVSFATKIWGRTKEFKAKIDTQRPDERVKWRVADGLTHTGVVTFHELTPRLTRVELSFDVEPGGLLEKAARGMRHIKRAARADLHRFKAYVEMHERETGAWRGVIEDGEVVEDHDPSYDNKREYFEESGNKKRSPTRKRSSSSNGAKRSSGSRSAASRRQGSPGRSQQSSRSSSRSGSRSSGSRSGSNASKSSGRSSGASNRSGSSTTRSRAGASRSNGRG
jgi:uncharacterized membrane protein